ncbi:MAG: hypothetical protein CFE26_10430 [Verrucomicrobiales bacterium VVV1]|nr:MAG: hypothetical protein CFE26_10430 [Verrucomicrobiales bacterium VVV1]
MPLQAFASLPAFKAFSPALTHLQRQALRSSLKCRVNVKARGPTLSHVKARGPTLSHDPFTRAKRVKPAPPPKVQKKRK